MQLVVIINSYNRRDLLVQAVGSLVKALGAGPMEYAIVVFEAGSTDGSREWIVQFAREHRDVSLEVIGALSPRDTSFAAGVNRACQYALEAFPEAEFIFLYETDNWLSCAEPVISAIQLLHQEPSLAAMGFTVRLHSGRPCGWGCAFPTVFSFVIGPQLSMWLGIPRAEVKMRNNDHMKWFAADVVYTSPLLIKASVWKSSGGIDAQLFPFSDSDLDWAWKVARDGYQLGVLSTDSVVHDNLETLSNWSGMRVIKFHQGRFRLLRKYRGLGVTLSIPALFLRHFVEYVTLALMVILGKRPSLSLEKRAILLKSVWSGYEAAG